MSFEIHIRLPDWMDEYLEWGRVYPAVEDLMRLAIELSRENTVRRTGGPFGAAIFESRSGALVAAGVNLVVPMRNSVLHAEIVAFMVGEQRLGKWTLAGDAQNEHQLVTSCDPCAMCLGAILWSGVKHVVSGADRDDAAEIRFDEGPVFPASYTYLEERGIEIVRGVLREEARDVLAMYGRTSGTIYNG